MSKIYLQEKIDPVPGQYVIVGRDGFLTAGQLSTEATPQLVITAPTGFEPSDFSATCNNKVKILNIDKASDTVFTCSLPEFGLWGITIHAHDGSIYEEYIDVTDIRTYNIALTENSRIGSLEVTTWAKIKQIVNEGLASHYWSVGDRKSVVLKNGTFGTITFNNNYTIYAYIIGIDHNVNVEGAGVTFQLGFPSDVSDVQYAFVDEYYNSIRSSNDKSLHMNYSASIIGWGSCAMRTLLNSDSASFYNVLPDDLTAVLDSKTIYTDNSTTTTYLPSNITKTQDKIFLLSEYEVLGARTHANDYENILQAQYSYYKSSSNSKVKYKYNSPSTPCLYWTRSKTSDSTYGYCYMSTESTSLAASGRNSLAVAPCFYIGSGTPTSTNIYITSEGNNTTSTTFRSSYIKILDSQDNVISGPWYNVRKLLVTPGDKIQIWGKRRSSTYKLNVKLNGTSVGTAATSNSSYSVMYTYTIQNTGLINLALVYTDSTTNSTEYVTITTT